MRLLASLCAIPCSMAFGLSMAPALFNTGFSRVQYLPAIRWTDSLSARQTTHDTSWFATKSFRYDRIIDSKDAQGRPLAFHIAETFDTTHVSASERLDWSPGIPGIAVWRQFGSTPARITISTAVGANEAEPFTGTFVWDPVARTITMTTSVDDSLCREKAMVVVLDAQNRMVSNTDCTSETEDSLGVTVSRLVIRTSLNWFDGLADSLPRRSSLREASHSTSTLLDSVYAVGNPNRPDTLLGTNPTVLFRDGNGRVVLEHPINGAGDTSFTYDAAGRLIREIMQGAGTVDTVLYLYSWNDAAGLRPASFRMSGARIVGRDLQLDLPAPDRIRVDILDLDGKRHGTIDRTFSAGRTSLPIAAPAGSLVRVRSSQGESILRIPPKAE
jgi:YD repeat-containing protein